MRGRPFPLPLVSGTIAGHPVLMLLDTGANSHVIAGWLARKLHLPMRRLGDTGADHVGAPITAYRVDAPQLAIDEWGPLAANVALATEVPEAIEKLGIGAFISPQRLEEDGMSVVLDLRKGDMRSTPSTEAGGPGASLVEPGAARVCEDDGPVKGVAYVVPGRVDGHGVRLLVDTGAQQSDLFAASEAGKKLLERSNVALEPLYTASGKVASRQIRGAHLSAGSVSVATNINLVRGAADSSCPRDGVLGMDVLRSCVLVFGRSRVIARCTQN
jgi:predicted aspartyl protease